MPELALLLAALLAAQGPAASSDPGLRPSAPADVASAVGDCWRAVEASGVDVARLSASGWSAVVDSAATPAAGPLDAYAKAGVHPRVLISRAPGAKSLCTVVARVSSPAQRGTALPAIQKSLLALDAKVRALRSGDSILFVSGPQFALIDALESDYVTAEQPGLRIMVGYKIAEKK